MLRCYSNEAGVLCISRVEKRELLLNLSMMHKAAPPQSVIRAYVSKVLEQGNLDGGSSPKAWVELLTTRPWPPGTFRVCTFHVSPTLFDSQSKMVHSSKPPGKLEAYRFGRNVNFLKYLSIHKWLHFWHYYRVSQCSILLKNIYLVSKITAFLTTENSITENCSYQIGWK